MRSAFYITFLSATLYFAGSQATCDEIDYNRDIRPILSNKCFQCHGPDEESRKAELRLDLREEAVKSVIIAGNPETSELFHRITTEDKSDLMPPPKVKKPITKREIALLKQWISEGSPYAGHWSFQAVDQSATLPKVKNQAWVQNPIDQFVLTRLEATQIKPSDPAPPETLARRLAIDLTGLLPHPDRVGMFVSNYRNDPQKAVSDYVDELLTSQHYGERWGRHWLDQARYADSHGYTIDGERIMWPYRDWVIHALNRDMPFDQFTIEQLAGDLLRSPTKHQLIASAFHRNTLINQEGGTDDEQFRNEEVVDRVNTTGAVWMGLTLGCAQCHTHKFDPITHRDYFQMFAFFNQGQDVNNTGATVAVAQGEVFADQADPEILEAYHSAKTTVATLEKQTAMRRKSWEAEQKKSITVDGPGSQWKLAKPSSFLAEGKSVLTRQKDDSILAAPGAPREVYRVILEPSGSSISAIRLRLIPDPSLPKSGPGLAGNGNIVLTRVEFYQSDQRLAVASAQHSHAQPGFSASYTIDDDPDTGWAINIGKGTPAGTRMNAPHEAHYIFDKPIRGDAPVTVVLRHEINDNYNIGRFGFDTSITKPLLIGKDALREALTKAEKDRNKEERTLIDAQFAKVDTALLDAKRNVKSAADAIGFGKEVKLMVMRDYPVKTRDTYIHTRGDFLRPDKKAGPLSPGVPVIFGELKESKENRTRLDLARWLVDPDNPLTARVTVNRVWMRYFGKGIVETENDFGTQGSFPTHPLLLDWLATRFMKDGWSMKQLHRLIVTSATYQQSSKARPDLEEVDSLNFLLARQNRIRFDAEIVRDAALSASGLLNPKIGGPGVTPAQPDGVYSFTQSKKTWVVPKNEERFRRALYIKFIRSAPYPLFGTFDAPDFQSVCTSRSRSNTPLQSLAMANDDALFELAQGLGTRLMEEIANPEEIAERITRAFELCYSRKPSSSEVDLLSNYQQNQKASFSADAAASKSVAPPEYPSQFDAATAASWTSVARVLMNTDEFIARE